MITGIIEEEPTDLGSLTTFGVRMFQLTDAGASVGYTDRGSLTTCGVRMFQLTDVGASVGYTEYHRGRV